MKSPSQCPCTDVSLEKPKCQLISPLGLSVLQPWGSFRAFLAHKAERPVSWFSRDVYKPLFHARLFTQWAKSQAAAGSSQRQVGPHPQVRAGGQEWCQGQPATVRAGEEQRRGGGHREPTQPHFKADSLSWFQSGKEENTEDPALTKGRGSPSPFGGLVPPKASKCSP